MSVIATKLPDGRMQLGDGRIVSRAEYSFMVAVEGKQRINTHFYDTKQLAATGLGAPAAPASLTFFDGNSVGDLTRTNFASKNQMEQDEYFDMTGISITPLTLVKVNEGANAAAAGIAANPSLDVDLLIKRSVLRMRIGSNEYGPWLTHSIGGDGGLCVQGGIATTTAAVTQLYNSAANGQPVVGRFWNFSHIIRWPGNKNLTMELIGATGAFSAAFDVRIAVYGKPFYRNYRPETGLHFGG